MTLNIGNRWGPYHEYIPYQNPCVVLLNLICLTESGFNFSLFSILKMRWWFQVIIWYSWDELTPPPTSDAKKTHPPKKWYAYEYVLCARVCTYVRMWMCVDVRLYFGTPQTKAVHMVLKVLQIVQNLAREVPMWGGILQTCWGKNESDFS